MQSNLDRGGAPSGSRAAGQDYPLWHPNTDVDHFREHGITIVEGDGVFVRDRDGKEYISATSGLWNASCGFRHPRIIEAATEQMQRLPYGTLFRYANLPAQQLAAKLVEIAPAGLERAFFTTSGSSAVEVALKAARGYQHITGNPSRQLVVSLSGSYHGILCGSMAVSGEYLEQEKYGVDTSRTRVIRTPDRNGCRHCAAGSACTSGCSSEFSELLDREGTNIAAVIVEPILGSGGVVMPPKEFFDALASACRKHGVLLIVDEVATGFGRTGRMFASEHYGLEPDIMVLSKGINSGYLPLGAVLFREEIFEAFRRSRTIMTGETQAGNPVSCAAALATLEVIEEERLVENAARIGAYLLEALHDMEEYRHVAEVRGKGLMVGVELTRDKDVGAAPSPADVMLTVQLLQREGLLVHPAPRGISLFPPLILSREDADDIVDALDSVLSRLYFGS